MEGLSIASAQPLMVRGDAPFMTWSPTPGKQGPTRWRGMLLISIEKMKDCPSPSNRHSPRSRSCLMAVVVAEGNWLVSCSCGTLSVGRERARVAMVQDGGWDTHARQNAVLKRKLKGLDVGMKRLQASLGSHWRHTAVVVVTEFGRTVGINGTRGTDHGTASSVLLAGGAVRGGRVHGEWPGLSRLRDNRDLIAAQDMRSVLKGVLRDHLHLDAQALDTRVFPDSRDARPLNGSLDSASTRWLSPSAGLPACCGHAGCTAFG